MTKFKHPNFASTATHRSTNHSVFQRKLHSWKNETSFAQWYYQFAFRRSSHLHSSLIPYIWDTLVGRDRVGIYNIIEEFQKEQEMVNNQVEYIFCIEQQPKRRKVGGDREKRIMTVVNNGNNELVIEYLRCIAHNASLLICHFNV